MASLEISGMDELLKKFTELSNDAHVKEVAKQAVNEALPTLHAAAVSAVAASEGTSKRATGSVSASMSQRMAAENSYGIFGVAGIPTGRDSKGVRNGAKAAYLEYGTPTMAARPWRATAVGSTQATVKSIVEGIIEQEMGGD